MRRALSRLMVGVCLAALSAAAVDAATHPWAAYPPNELACSYGKPYEARAETSIGDITFVECYPDAATLTDAEKYMLVGTRQGPPSDFRCLRGSGLSPWLYDICTTLQVYYRRFGEIPPRVTAQVYADAYGMPLDEVEPLMVELLRSPLSGEYPRTDAREFSPGDLFVKTLSDAEMQHFAAIHPFYYECWFNSRVQTADGEWKDLPLSGPVWYVRLYGLNDVIYNELRFGGVLPTERVRPWLEEQGVEL